MGTVTVFASVYGGDGVFVGGGIYNSKVISGYQQIAYEYLAGLLMKIEVEVRRFQAEYRLMLEQASWRPNANVLIVKILEFLFEKRRGWITPSDPFESS